MWRPFPLALTQKAFKLLNPPALVITSCKSIFSASDIPDPLAGAATPTTGIMPSRDIHTKT